MEPQKECTFGGIAQHLQLLRIGEVNRSGRVHRHTFGHELANGSIVVGVIVFCAVEVGIVNAHLVLRQRTGFVGTNHRSSTHGFASVHFAHQVIGFQHTAHAVGQAERHSHGKSFGHRHYDECHSNHDGLQHVGHEGSPVVDIKIGLQAIYRDASHENEQGKSIAQFGNPSTESFKLFVKGCFYAIVNLCSFEHFTLFGFIADAYNAGNAVSFHHLCTLVA